MPEQGHKPPRISDNYIDDSPHLDIGEGPSTQDTGSFNRPNSILNRGMEIASNSAANHEGLSNRI